MDNVRTSVELPASGRALRGVIGAGALLMLFFASPAPDLTAAWVFGLAMVGFYASMTAALGFDFVEAAVKVIDEDCMEQAAETEGLPQQTEIDGYRKAA